MGEIVRQHAGGAGLLFEFRAPVFAMFVHGSTVEVQQEISVRQVLAV
jgi:hypothetical protein